MIAHMRKNGQPRRRRGKGGLRLTMQQTRLYLPSSFPRHTRPGKLHGGLPSANTIGLSALSITQSCSSGSEAFVGRATATRGAEVVTRVCAT